MPPRRSATQNGRLQRPPIGESGAFDAQMGAWFPLKGGLFRVNRDGGAFVRRASVLDLENMLERDPQAMGLEAVLTLPILATTFRIEEGDGDKGEAELARQVFLRPAREGGMRTPISDVVAQMCGAFARRQAFFEKVWKIRGDGRLVYDKLAFRRASTCEVVVDTKTKSYAGFAQDGYFDDGTSFGYKHFPPNKAFVYVHGTSSRNPMEGRSAFEAAYPAYVNKQKVELLRYMYLQKFGIPPVIGTTTDPTEEGQEAFEEKIEALRSGSYAVLNEYETIDTLTAAQTVGGSTGGSADFRETLRYLDAQMATSMLAGFIQLPVEGAGGAGGGSYAMHRDSTDLFLLSCEARQREVENTITNDAIADLVYHNFGDKASYPRFKMTALSLEHETKSLDLFKAGLSTGSAPPMPTPVWNLVRDKGLAALDINQDAIEHALEAARSAANPPGGVDPRKAESELQKAVSGLVKGGDGASLPAQARALAEELAEEILEFVYNPTKQNRDPYGRFGGTSVSNDKRRSKKGTAGAVGGGARSKIDPRLAKSPPSKPPHAPATPGGKAKDSLGSITLPGEAGEQVHLAGKPPVGGHFVLGGIRGEKPTAVFLGLEDRELSPDEARAVAEEASGVFDTAQAACIGRFDPETGTLDLRSLGDGASTEGVAVIDAIKAAYGPALVQLIVDGKRSSQQEPPSAEPEKPEKPGAKKPGIKDRLLKKGRS